MHIFTKETFKKVLSVFVISFMVVSFFGIYMLGLVSGYKLGKIDAQSEFLSLLQETPETNESLTVISTPTPTLRPVVSTQKDVAWGGPELWQEVNTRRAELGVNPLAARDELCTIASIRLNELLELGKLDGHVGFSDMSERRPDLKWIFERYSVIAEFLALGGKTPEETVSLWENTLGHKKLLTGGEYVWGCIYAQNTFAVAITAF